MTISKYVLLGRDRLLLPLRYSTHHGAQKICSNDALACTVINHELKVSIEDLGFATYKLTIAYINSERWSSLLSVVPHDRTPLL